MGIPGDLSQTFVLQSGDRKFQLVIISGVETPSKNGLSIVKLAK